MRVRVRILALVRGGVDVFPQTHACKVGMSDMPFNEGRLELGLGLWLGLGLGVGVGARLGVGVGLYN